MALSNYIEKKIKIWAIYAKEMLCIPEETANLSLEGLVAESLEKGDILLESNFAQLYNVSLPLPLDRDSFHEKLERLRGASQIITLHGHLLQVCSSISAENISSEDVYKAILEFLNFLDGIIVTPSPARTFSGAEDSKITQALQSHWKQPYVGPSCDVLRDTIRESEAKFSVAGDLGRTYRKYYSKTLTFMQSSGTGKSRLANEYGMICPMITYVIRDPASGFPPSDEKVYWYLRSEPSEELRNTVRLSTSNHSMISNHRIDYIWFHAVAIGILQATFRHCNKLVTEQMKRGRSARETSTLLAAKLQKFYGDTERPESRNLFYNKIVDSAETISASCVECRSFCRLFGDSNENLRKDLEESSCKPMNELRAAANDFQKTLQNWEFQHDNDPFFTIVFDEVSSLMGDAGNGRFIALNRIISAISDKNKIWFLFLSTESKLDKILSSDRALPFKSGPSKPSSRQVIPNTDPPLNRYSPFTSFAVDLEDLKNGFQINVAGESMLRFSEVTHMGRFGRPLWSAYDDPHRSAMLKLIGGRRIYDEQDRDHVFAVLSIRLCLDVDLSNPVTYPLSQTAVHLHMRIADSIDPSTGYLFTRTPAEPILALAAAIHLCSSNSWSESLQTFTSDLLSLGAISKGSKGEMFARLIFLLARDAAATPLPVKTDNAEEAVPLFTVRNFLRALFSEKYHEKIGLIDSAILDAHLNFLMFTSTRKYLSSDHFGSLCHALLRRSAAMQCAPGQELYDLFIPFYCGEPDQPYSLSEAGAIVVQVKNRESKSSPQRLLDHTFFDVSSVGEQKEPGANQERLRKRKTESGSKFIFDRPGTKLLYILLDLGADTPDVQVTYSKSEQPRMWAIHCSGHDENTFGCLKDKKIAEAAKDFFCDLMKPAQGDNIAFRHNADLPDNVFNHDQLKRELPKAEKS